MLCIEQNITTLFPEKSTRDSIEHYEQHYDFGKFRSFVVRAKNAKDVTLIQFIPFSLHDVLVVKDKTVVEMCSAFINVHFQVFTMNGTCYFSIGDVFHPCFQAEFKSIEEITSSEVGESPNMKELSFAISTLAYFQAPLNGASIGFNVVVNGTSRGDLIVVSYNEQGCKFVMATGGMCVYMGMAKMDIEGCFLFEQVDGVIVLKNDTTRFVVWSLGIEENAVVQLRPFKF